MGFKDELFEFGLSLEKSDESDLVIKEEDVLTALVILNFIEYKKVPDIFLACASMNLLNAYARTGSSKIGYQYKRHLTEVIKGIEDIHQPKSILIGYDNTNNMQLLIVQFWSFQFSFQAQRLSSSIQQLISSKPVTWDGIRKQPHAKRFSILHLAEVGFPIELCWVLICVILWKERFNTSGTDATRLITEN